MNVKILRVETDELTGATIRNGKPVELPSMHQGWRFNFDKLIRKLPHATAYVLVANDSPDIIQGCLIFQMLDKKIPYMAYVEVAPHNRAEPKVYEYVAGCLIAFAFKQSVIQGKGDYKALLSFDVKEEKEEDQQRLMALYSSKYHALRVDETTMWITDEGGHALIEKYLNRASKD